jgi:hypothetical protein
MPLSDIFRALFHSKERRHFQAPLGKPLPAHPPPLPRPNSRYVLYSCGDGCYDIDDGDNLVGMIYRQQGDKGRDLCWSTYIGDIGFDFRTLKKAKAWLGNPPVRQCR